MSQRREAARGLSVVPIGSCVSAPILENSAPFQAGIAQLVERDLAKVEATSSNLVTRSNFPFVFSHLPYLGAARVSLDFLPGGQIVPQNTHF